MSVSYIGSGNYCYANSMAMALQEFGEYDPGYLECLSTVAVSACWLAGKNEEFIFFSSKFASPDVGISQALRNLGFLFEGKFYTHADRKAQYDAISVLQNWVKTGPVIVGPVDMGKLSYIPFHKDLQGVDHYVVVHCIEGVCILSRSIWVSLYIDADRRIHESVEGNSHFVQTRVLLDVGSIYS